VALAPLLREAARRRAAELPPREAAGTPPQEGSVRCMTPTAAAHRYCRIEVQSETDFFLLLNLI